jgi:hypothetical protein
MDKLCKRCGKDVSQTRRVKDPHGNYYCEPCYAAAKAARSAAAPKDELDFADAAPAPAKTPPADDYDLVPVQEVKEEPKAPCGVCKQFKPERLVQFVDGESICNSCLAARQNQKPGKAEKQTKRETNPDNLPTPFVIFMTSGIGVAITAVASILGTLLVMTLVFSSVTQSLEMEVPLSDTLLNAAIFTFIIIVLSGFLLVSMLIVDKLLGGVGFGSISGVIWKSMLIMTVQIALSIVGSVNETVSYSNYATGPVSNLIFFMLLFRLDFFESMLLSIANWLIGYMAFLAIAAFFWSGRGLPAMHRGQIKNTPPHHHQPEDEPIDIPDPATHPATMPKNPAAHGAWIRLPQQLNLAGTGNSHSSLMLLRRTL